MTTNAVITALRKGELPADQQKRLASYLSKILHRVAVVEKNDRTFDEASKSYYVDVEIFVEDIERLEKVMKMPEEQKLTARKLFDIVWNATNFKVNWNRKSYSTGVGYESDSGENYVFPRDAGFDISLKSKANYRKALKAVRTYIGDTELDDVYRITTNEEEHDIYIDIR